MSEEVKLKGPLDSYKLEDGTEYNPGDALKFETREYHQTTHYINREIPVDDIIEEFGNLVNFEKACYQSYKDDDYDSELDDKYWEFVQQYDYERHEDLWTDRKGGYDVDSEIVNEFTMD